MFCAFLEISEAVEGLMCQILSIVISLMRASIVEYANLKASFAGTPLFSIMGAKSVGKVSESAITQCSSMVTLMKMEEAVLMLLQRWCRIAFDD